MDGEYSKYLKSKEFKLVKKIVEERDGAECAACGRTRRDGVNLVCHHKRYKHLYEGGSAEAEDCVILCTICHKAIHSSKKNISWFRKDNSRNDNSKDA